MWRPNGATLAGFLLPKLMTKPMSLKQLRRQLARVKSYKRHSMPCLRAGWDTSIRYWQNEIAYELRRRQ